MTDTPAPPIAVPNEAHAAPVLAPATRSGRGAWLVAGGLLLVLAAGAALLMAWTTQQHVEALEAELVKRQQDSAGQATEARTLARQAEVAAREAAAKLALLDARVAETSMQRTQLEELIQSLARSRDENVLSDLDAAIRVAMQQSAITGSAEPVITALRQADERLARYNQPRLERVRRAVVQDLDRTRAAGVTDVTLLTVRLDEVIRQVDELPLLSLPEKRAARTRGDAATGPASPQSQSQSPPAPSAAVESAAVTASAAGTAASAPLFGGWLDGERWRDLGWRTWNEVKSLVRVARIDRPEAMLLAPEQSYFLRENVKLRLLNARLALLSRQFETAQSDLRDVQAAIDRYFDRDHRRVAAAAEVLRQVASQARQSTAPRPDATLAAIATAASGR